jgi:6-pyruvoyltetrahydropterin/6-carboxytetrahydropterin synthase
VPSPTRFTLYLAKSDFKFAAAHFTWFADGTAERLHGHNYTVRVEVSGPHLAADGMLVEARVVKAEVRRLCAALDERVLLPEPSARVAVEAHARELEARVAGRSYRLPAADVVRLPVANVTVECLAEHLWRELARALAPLALDALAVEVAESDGQSARCEGALHTPPEGARGV